MTVSDPSLTPVNDLADRFWEAVLELNPTTATLYGDDRYADRLEDPGPDGRGEDAARSWSERPPRPPSIETSGLPTEDRITRDMLKVIAELQIEEDDLAFHQLRVVDQMGGPQQVLPQLTQFQPADTPGAARGVHRPPARVPGVHGRQRADPARRPRIGPDRPAHRRRTDDRPGRAPARGPDRVGRRAVDGQGGERGATASASATSCATWSTRPTRPSSTPCAATTCRRPVTSRDCGRRPTARTLYRTAIRSWTTLELDPEAVHRIGLDELESIEAERREITRAAGFGDDTAAYRAALDADIDNTPQTKDELVARATEDIERAMAIAPRYFGTPAASRLRRAAGRGIQGEGRAVRLLLPAVAGRLTARASTTRTGTTCRAASTPSSRRRPTTRRFRVTTSRSRSRWRTRT